MPSELSDGLPAAERPQVPDLETSVVRPRGEEVRHVPVPADDVHVLLVRLEAEHRPILLAEVPDRHRLVGGGGGEHLSVRAWFEILHTYAVRHQLTQSRASIHTFFATHDTIDT